MDLRAFNGGQTTQLSYLLKNMFMLEHYLQKLFHHSCSSMASSSLQQGNGHLMFKYNSPYFYKIILQDSIQKGKLGIPRKFVENHGNDMSSPAMLRVPSGEVWKVELSKCDGKILLENGWLEFSKHYSLELGYLLVFRYDGNNNFHVVIFNRSASEIQYPCTSNNHRRPQSIDGSEDDDSKQIQKSQLSCPRQGKMMRSTNSATKTETGCFWKSGSLAPPTNSDKSTSHNRIHSLKFQEKVKALESARSTFKFENPFFLVVVQPDYVGLSQGKKYRLSIPRNFVEKHLMQEHCSSSGKTWTVSFNQKHFGKKLYSYLQTGWRTFVRDNNIQVGDVCAFELINSIKISFKVLIHRGQHANRHQQLTSTHMPRPVKRKPQSTQPLTLTALQRASALKTENPSFVIVLQPSYVNSCRLTLPVDFARKYLTKMVNQVILLLSNGKSWPVIYYQHRIEGPKPNVKFGDGWSKFVVDNNLDVGDACVFQLTEAAVSSMNVTIYKKQAVEDANPGSSSGK